MTNEMKKEYITLDKDAFSLMKSVLHWENLKCTFCGKHIDEKNFGLISKDVISCNDIICEIQAVDKFENEAKKCQMKS